MSFREELIAVTMKSMGCERDQAEVIVDRVGDRLGGMTHEEAVTANPYPREVEHED